MPGSRFFSVVTERLVTTFLHPLSSLATGWKKNLPWATAGAFVWQGLQPLLDKLAGIYGTLFTVDPYLASGAFLLLFLDTVSGVVGAIVSEDRTFNSAALGHFTSKVLGYGSVVIFFAILANGAEQAASPFGAVFGMLDDVALIYVIIREGKSLNENTHDMSFANIGSRISDAFSSMKEITDSSK